MKRFISFLTIILISGALNAAEQKKDSLKVYRTPSIEVTTTNAVERESPVPFVEISKAEIKRDYTLTDLPHFLSDMPSVIVSSQSGNGIGYTDLTMRGFGQRRLSVMINGIPQNDPEDHNVYWVDFPDIAESLESIQIQRGAGVSSYGAAAIGGSINLITSNFADKQFLRLSSGIGFQEYGASGSALYQPTMNKNLIEFSSGLSGNYAFYGRLSRVETSGYRDRSWAKLNSYFFSAVRFDDDVTTQVNIFGGPLSDGLVYDGLPKSYIGDKSLRRKNYSWWNYGEDGITVDEDWLTERKKQEIEEFSQPHYELLNDWKINDNLTFKSALFYYTGTGYFDFDGSWANSDIQSIMANDYEFGDGEEISIDIIRAFVDNRHGGWIPRLIYNHGQGELTVGTELRMHRSDHWGKVNYAQALPAGYDPDYKFYSYNGKRDIFSLFASEKYRLNEDLIVSGELQFVYHRYAIDNEMAGNSNTVYNEINGGIAGDGNELFNINYYFLNPRFGMNYNIDKNQYVFASIAHTSREPRMSNLYQASESYYGASPMFEAISDSAGNIFYDFTKPIVNPEKMLDFELGWAFRNSDYYIGTNIYWMEYFDELVKSGKTDLFGDPIDGNAPRSRHYGLEIQGSAVVAKVYNADIVISGNATISQNPIVEFDYISEDEGRSKYSLEGNSVAGFPDFMANIRFSYVSDNLYFSISGKYVGPFKTDNFGDMLQNDAAFIMSMKDAYAYYADNEVDSYFVVNADFSYSFSDILSLKEIKIRARVNNLLNELYAASGEGEEFFPAAERNIYIGIDLNF